MMVTYGNYSREWPTKTFWFPHSHNIYMQVTFWVWIRSLDLFLTSHALYESAKNPLYMVAKQLNIKRYFVKMPGQGQIATDANNNSLPQEDEPMDDMDVTSGTKRLMHWVKNRLCLIFLKGPSQGSAEVRKRISLLYLIWKRVLL